MEDYCSYIDPVALTAAAADWEPSELAALERVNRKVAEGASLDEVMHFLFESTRELYPCDRIGVAFLEDQDRRIVSRWVRAEYEPVHLPVGYSEGRAGSSLDEVLASGRLRIISDLEGYLAAHPGSHSSRLLVKEGVRSSMTCPLVVAGRRVGVMFRSARRPQAYDHKQARLHATIAERLSQAVEKAYRIDQLSAANQSYLELLSFASHELRSPLATLVMDGDLLLRGYHGDLNATQRERLESMVERARALIASTQEYLGLSRYESGALQIRPERQVAVGGRILDPVLEEWASQLQARDMNCEVQGGAEVMCDPELMKDVFNNLIGNAIKYGAAGGRIRIVLEQESAWWRAKVWNSGPGFPKAKIPQLFKRFSRLRLPEHQGVRGTGVGLYLVWQIVQLHGGKIWAQSEYGQWAEFILEVPQPLPLSRDGDL